MGEQKRRDRLPPDIQRELMRQKTEEQSAPVKQLEQRIEQASDAILTLFVVATAEAKTPEERDDCTRAAAIAMATVRQMLAAFVNIIPASPRAIVADAIVKTIELSAPNFESTLVHAMPAGHQRRKRLLEVGPEQFERENELARTQAAAQAEALSEGEDQS